MMHESNLRNLRIINSSYDRIIEVLGKSDDDAIFLQLIKDLGEMPEVIDCPPDSSQYLFSKSGLALQFMGRSKCFVAAFFHFASAAVRTGQVKPYTGNLALDINFGDSHEDVASKLGIEPVVSRTTTGEIHEEYALNSYELHCKFDSAEKLQHLSVWFTPACFWRRTE